jgi:hypothetical protein
MPAAAGAEHDMQPIASRKMVAILMPSSVAHGG